MMFTDSNCLSTSQKVAYCIHCVQYAVIGERDTIRGVQIRAGEVYVYIYIYICMEVRVTK